MSIPPEPPKRLAEILLEILALSNSPRSSHSNSINSGDSGELSDAQCADDQAQRMDTEDNDPPTL